MAGDYNLYCNFDLEKHKQTYVNYLEVLICEDGTVVYAVPSHQEKAIALACSRLHVTRETLEMMCPHEYYGDYMTWLCMAARVVAVWNAHCVAVYPTSKQIAALRRLKMAGVYTGSIPKEHKYLESLQQLPPVERERRLLGKWIISEEGE